MKLGLAAQLIIQNIKNPGNQSTDIKSQEDCNGSKRERENSTVTNCSRWNVYRYKRFECSSVNILNEKESMGGGVAGSYILYTKKDKDKKISANAGN